LRRVILLLVKYFLNKLLVTVRESGLAGSQAVVIGVGWIIKTLNPLYANRARNRTAIRTQNRTRVVVTLSFDMAGQ
jgi:hypothetical protein